MLKYVLDNEGNKLAMIPSGKIEYISFRKNLVVKYVESNSYLVIENPDQRTLQKYTEEWYAQNEYNSCRDSNN